MYSQSAVHVMYVAVEAITVASFSITDIVSNLVGKGVMLPN